jgi:hypothetical protein
LDIKAGQVLDLDVTPITWFFSKFRALQMHPQHLVRFGFGFSMIGLAVGLLALIIAILPPAISIFGQPWAWAGYVTIGFTLTLALVVGYLIAAAISTFKG